jgi:mono/diheme cytochrome c family protein
MRGLSKNRSLFLLALCLAGSAAGCGKGPGASLPPSTAAGRTCFEQYCSACHHPEGLGIPGGPPPLVGSPWLAGPDARLIRIVLHGAGGPLEIGGKSYNLEMPAFGPVLSDAQIATVLSFARARFTGSEKPVAPEEVARVRAATSERDTYWTFPELLEFR